MGMIMKIRSKIQKKREDKRALKIKQELEDKKQFNELKKVKKEDK